MNTTDKRRHFKGNGFTEIECGSGDWDRWNAPEGKMRYRCRRCGVIICLERGENGLPIGEFKCECDDSEQGEDAPFRRLYSHDARIPYRAPHSDNQWYHEGNQAPVTLGFEFAWSGASPFEKYHLLIKSDASRKEVADSLTLLADAIRQRKPSYVDDDAIQIFGQIGCSCLENLASECPFHSCEERVSGEIESLGDPSHAVHDR